MFSLIFVQMVAILVIDHLWFTVSRSWFFLFCISSITIYYSCSVLDIVDVYSFVNWKKPNAS